MALTIKHDVPTGQSRRSFLVPMLTYVKQVHNVNIGSTKVLSPFPDYPSERLVISSMEGYYRT